MNLLNIFKGKENKTSVQAINKKYDGYFSQQIMIPPKLNTADFLNAYSSNTWVYSCVNKITQNCASIPIQAYKGETVTNSNALNVLKKPNPFMSQYEFMAKIFLYLELVGKVFIYIASDKANRPRECYIINPLDMIIIPDKDKYIKGYIYRAGAENVPFDPNEIIFINYFDPINPYNGISPLMATRNSVEIDTYSAEYMRNFYYNDCTPGGILNFPEGLSDDQFESMRAQFEDRHKGSSNAKKLAILEGNATYTQVGVNPKDNDFSSIRDKSRDEICSAFGVPQSILGLHESSSYASSEVDFMTFAKYTLTPKLKLVQDKLNNEFLVLFGEEQLELRFDNIVPEDKAFIKSIIDTQTDKTITKNEGRQALNKLMGWNLPDLKDGDVIYQAVSLQPLGTALPTLAASVKPNNPTDTPPEDNPEPNKLLKKTIDKTYRKKVAREILKNNATRNANFLKMSEPLQSEFNGIIKDFFKSQQKEVVQNILDGSKDPLDLKKANKDLINATSAIYVKCFQTGGKAVVNEFKSIGNYVHKDLGINFDIKDPAVQAKIQSKISKITQVNTDTKQKIKNIIEDAYSNSNEDNEEFTIKNIAEKIGSADFAGFSDARCILISQTEVLTSLNQATNETYKQNSDLIDGKAWLSNEDDLVRASHQQAAEDYSVDSPIGVDEQFDVGGNSCDCPGDDGLPAEEVCNCRCCMCPVVNVN